MIKYYFKNNTINILLYNSGNITGIIKVFKRTDKQGVLDLFIRPKYRSRWLSKELYFNLKSKFIDICSKIGYNVIVTRLNNEKSLPLLNHFGFMKYNEKYYYLGIY
jgi:GNAT superfamily N-acetyltransferase